MRRGFFLRVRPDFVSALLTQGRLADVPLFQYFSVESVTAATPNNGNNGVTATKKDDAGRADGAVLPDCTMGGVNRAGPAAPVIATPQQVRLRERCDAVRAAAKKYTQPAVCFGSSNGELTEWCAPPNSQDSVRVALTNDKAGEPGHKVAVHGSFTAATASGSTSKTMKLLATPEERREGCMVGGREPLLLSLQLNQENDRVHIAPSACGMCTITLKGAEATILTNSGAVVDTFTAEHNLLAAAAASGMIDKLLQICALHATHAARHDALLIRNPAVQRALALMACCCYGIDALTSFVVGCGVEVPNPPAKQENSGGGKEVGEEGTLHLQVAEAVTVGTYASQALATALELARETLDGALKLFPAGGVPHASNPERLIDYACVERLLRDEYQTFAALSIGGGTQLCRYVAPLLSSAMDGLHGGSGARNDSFGNSLFMCAINSASSVPRLVSPHVYLHLSADAIETDVAAFLKLLRTGGHRQDQAFVRTAAQYAAEVFASVAVVYRASAALTQSGNNAPRDWLLAQAFCGESTTRRALLLREFEVSKAARAAFLTAGKDGNTTHPVELMNAAPVRKIVRTSSQQQTASSTASASFQAPACGSEGKK